jgi:signal transduction histidine kinase
VVVHPIAAVDLPDIGLDPASATAPQGPPRLLGYVALELSREDVVRRGQALVMAGLAVTSIGLALGGLLALQLFSRATAELSAKKDEAERATRAKTRFLAVASHDLRQPVHALGLFVERLGQQRHEEATRPLIASVEASVRSLQDLLDELLDMSRLDSGMVQPRLAPVALAEVWADLQRQFAPAAARTRLELRMRPSPLWVMSDEVLLKRALCNLVSNALRYTDHGGVLVACRRHGKTAFIEVWDTGIGIPSELHKEVFQEFVQFGGPRRGREPGLGLGLAIVDRTAALLEHPLSLRSVLGRGSRFRLEAPIAEPAMAGAAADAPMVAAHSLAGLRVLLVDDDPVASEATARLLHSWGCVPTTAASGPEAFARADPATDIIACDYRLSEGEDGVAVVQRLRSQLGRQVPAFLVSADTGPEALRAASEAGLALLYKPVRPARLRAVVQRLSRGLKP